jgi:hypothetical protein
MFVVCEATLAEASRNTSVDSISRSFIEFSIQETVSAQQRVFAVHCSNITISSGAILPLDNIYSYNCESVLFLPYFQLYFSLTSLVDTLSLNSLRIYDFIKISINTVFRCDLCVLSPG